MMTMFKTLLLGTALAVGSVTLVQAQSAAGGDPMIKSIDASIQFSKVDANALEFFPTLETDLEQALGEALEPLMADDGGRLIVIVYDLGVDGNALLTSANEINTIHGGVQYFPPNSDQSQGASPVTPKVTDIKVIAVPGAPAVVEPGVDYLILPSDQTVYDVMVAKFAEVVAERLPAL